MSVSIGALRITDSKTFNILIAVALFDHCSVKFFELSRSAADPSKLVFKDLPDRHMMNIHKIPVCMIRLSKKYPQLMISCGDESDLYVKLWNIATSRTEPVNSL